MILDRLLKPSETNSFFLFGARGTGKSTWIKQEFLTSKPHLYIDLLDSDQEETYTKDPMQLYRQLERGPDKTRWVAIDEIQKIPKLLDVVHKSIEDFKTRFVLTGSSARKLKRGRANLLAGRAFVQHLFPLTHVELGTKFKLASVLAWGGLPKVLQFDDDKDRERYLHSYTQTYLKEEILVEQIVRKLDPFRHFLEIAAQQNSEVLNYSNIARDVGVQIPTIQSYFEILEDTLMGFLLPPFHKSWRKRQAQNPKFYFFDLGIKRSLEGLLLQPLIANTFGYGKSFEHFLIAEIIRLSAYAEKRYRFSYLRTKDGAEIDLIIERPGLKTCLIEIKSAQKIDERAVRTLAAFKKDLKNTVEYYCFSQDPIAQTIDGIHLLSWREGLKAIGLG